MSPIHETESHSVYWLGRLFYIVTSNSRPGLLHFVDLEESTEWNAGFLCTCEAFKFGERPCRHATVSIQAIAAICGIPLADEWCDQLCHLMRIGHSFEAALKSDSMQKFKVNQPIKQ